MVKEAVIVLTAAIAVILSVLLRNKKRNTLPRWLFLFLYYVLCGAILFGASIILLEFLSWVMR